MYRTVYTDSHTVLFHKNVNIFLKVRKYLHRILCIMRFILNTKTFKYVQ
jgi:hypothetical protein